ncbi:hypothetical protein EUGRSUZ_H02801 [Eucalyptus grandis]|uniref:Uncharacterized protein n=2 Tax=Eucalyptus grandis TaxID=71139 RepID=A0A059B2G3_EUCGR|nr:hypothetical protein EUGRSUZ_H02801 [Eucalyptus grandis]
MRSLILSLLPLKTIPQEEDWILRDRSWSSLARRMSNHQRNQHAGIYDRSMVQDHVSIHIEDMLRDMPATSPEHSIFRVHHQLREVNEKAYEPVILAIGPYHYGNGKFKFMEEQKLRYLQQLLNRRQEGSVDRYVMTLRELEQQARNCYAETIDLSQEKFLAMMLIDGCFIIELLRKCILEKSRDEDDSDRLRYYSCRYLDDPLRESDWLQYYLRRDLLLLENQLPLFVLSKLYDLTKGPDEHHEFNVVAIEYLTCEEGGPDRNWTRGNWEHLLHLYYGWRTHGLPEKPLPHCTLVMPSAIELRESGIRFRAAKGRHLGDIKFENGTLEIPVLDVEDDTESEFRNLIAYEQLHQRRDIYYFTHYVNLMDFLINSSKDVEILRCTGIIKNYLGDDKAVAQMFNKMCDEVLIFGSYYSEIFQNVKAHCDKRRNVWMAKLRREYFHSPWAFLSVVTVIVLLLLTATETVFTVLSYMR